MRHLAVAALAAVVAAAPATAAPRLVLSPADRAAATAAGLDLAGLAQVVAVAERQRTRALVVKRGGKTVLARRWGRQEPLQAMMQATYPIVALAMGALVAEGKIPTLDAPLGRWLPAFREGGRARITLRHVMTGTDAIVGPEPWPGGLYRQPDYVRYYARAAVRGAPGSGQASPRESVVLLGPVVRAATGMPIDAWVASRLFAPLGITKHRWRKDEAGNVDVWAGLWLAPADAMRIGELVLAEGRWNGKAVVPRAWLLEATSPVAARHGVPVRDAADDRGYGWSIARRVHFREEDVARLRREGYAQAERLRPAIGGTYRSHADLQRAARALVDDAGWAGLLRRRERELESWIPCRFSADRRDGVVASDYVGNALVVNPAKRLVALRTVPWDGRPLERGIADFEFDDLADRLDAAAR